MIFDIECDGLNPTKIHVMAYEVDGVVHHTTDYNEMKKLLLGATFLVGHNIIMFDIPVVERILNIKVSARLIDTLVLSWYLNHTRARHGLEGYGVDFGVPKPSITDWDSLSVEEYTHRCREDVKINLKLYYKLKDKLVRLYGGAVKAQPIIFYLMNKMSCIRLQEESKWKIDLAHVTKNVKKLEVEEQEKLGHLISVMPLNIKYGSKVKPPKPYKKNGDLSVAGAAWYKLLLDEGLHHTHEEPVEFILSETSANPSSHIQVKDWLFSLGWEPTTFKYIKNDKGERSIPQIRVDGPDGKELCPSVVRISEKHQDIMVLEGLTVIQHRLSILKGFLRDEVDGYLKARVGGLTNTLRFKHRELVNLPGIHKPLGDVIRGSLIAREGKILCGSDMVSLEDTTKRHYMYTYDPVYVKEMSVKGFDPHLDLAKFAGAVTQDDIDSGKDVSMVRKNFKAANYACIYGVKGPTLSRQCGLTVPAANKLIAAYWDRNWAVEEVIKSVKIKTIEGEMWLYNPVSKFWYSLRNEKDKFSTLNQGTGVYCFDTWIKHFMKVRPQITAQFHDEIILEIPIGKEGECTKLLKDAIMATNKELNLNVQLDVDIQFGNKYSEIH